MTILLLSMIKFLILRLHNNRYITKLAHLFLKIYLMGLMAQLSHMDRQAQAKHIQYRVQIMLMIVLIKVSYLAL